MTAFTTLLNALFIPGKPILGSTGSALRDNAIAIAEGDPSVPVALRVPSQLLGTLTTTSGTTQTLSGLDLTPYKFLFFVFNLVSFSNPASILLDGKIASMPSTATNQIYGGIRLDLQNGVYSSSLSAGNSAAGTVGQVWSGKTAYSSSSTSISFSSDTPGSASFDSGSIRVYGEK